MDAQAESFGATLRRLRGTLPVRALAARAYISRSWISALENGRQVPSREAAERLDKALCADGELLAAYKKETRGRNTKFPPSVADTDFIRTLDLDGLYDRGVEETDRRRLLGLAASVGILGFDEMVRQELDLTTTPYRSMEDWDIARADHLYALRTRPPAQVVRNLSIDLFLLRQQMRHANDNDITELHRAAAMLAAIQANALTRKGDHGSAISWWRTAKKNADASRDLELSLLVRGEEAIHGLYGQREPETVLRLIQNARRLTTRPWLRLLAAEAKALALLHRSQDATATLHALHDHMDRGVTGDRWDFFRPDQIPFAESWVAAYAGDEAAADAARDRVLQIIPERSYQYRWNARLHEAISTAALGGVDEAAKLAAGLIDALPAEFRTNHIRETARMVLRAVPVEQQARSSVAELRSVLAIEAG